ncbi:MAG: hypothetical protein ACRC6R_06815 [Bacteroidales bacterium]
MFYTILIVLLIVALSVLLLGVKVFFVKGGKFPNTHIGGNAALSRKGISCAKTSDKEEQSKSGLFERMNSELINQINE